MDRSSAPLETSRTLAIILAGGRGSRLHDLTDAQAKPALPVGPSARLIDFTLANVLNSGIGHALVLTQYAPDGLHRHLRKTWQPARGHHGLAIDIAEGHLLGGFQGTADAVAKSVAAIDRHAPEHVVILAGDHLYQMDYRPFIRRHVRAGAQVTVGAVHVPLDEACEFGVMTLDADGRIIAFDEKPARPREALDRPGFALASMGIYVFQWSFLRTLLDAMARDQAELDFGKHILPLLVEGGLAYGHALPGRGTAAPLWRDLGTVDAYHGVHADLLAGRLPLDPAWPIPTAKTALPPQFAGPGSGDLRFLLRPGRPRLTHCSVGEGAVIGDRSVLDNVVILPGARIGRDVVVSDAIIAGDAVIPDGFHLDRALAVDGRWCTISEGGIRILSARALKTLSELETLSAARALERLNDNLPPAQWTTQGAVGLLTAPNP